MTQYVINSDIDVLVMFETLILATLIDPDTDRETMVEAAKQWLKLGHNN